MKDEASAELARNWNDSIREKLEPEFRHELEASLYKNVPGGAAQRRQAIRTQKKYQWIGSFYPAVFWQDYKVLFLTVKKLMSQNISIAEPAFDYLPDRRLKDSIVCIDEFDASRKAILDSLIEESLRMQADYLQLFMQVYKGICIHRSSRELTALRERFEAGQTVTWQNLLDQAKSIYQFDGQSYMLRRLVRKDPDQKQQRFVIGSLDPSRKNTVQFLEFGSLKEFESCKVGSLTKFMEDVKDLLSPYLALTEVDFVRASAWTVLPFPFKYLR